jgi:hypothetical protein
LSKSKNLFARIDSDLAVLKWMTGTILAGVVALCLRAASQAAPGRLRASCPPVLRALFLLG